LLFESRIPRIYPWGVCQDKEVELAEAAEAQVEVLREAIASIVLEPQVPGDDTSGIAEFDILPALAAWYERRDVGEEEHF
jgi:hypothetical protein